MLGFVIPFRSKASSKNWKYHSALLIRTIKSICNQLHDNFKVIVVYSDYPEGKVTHKNLTYLHFPFPFLYAKDITDYKSFFKEKHNYTEEYAQYEMDQGRRILYGCQCAINQGCSYIMSVDADDLVSNKLTCFVNKNPVSTSPGWYANTGYIFLETHNIIYRYPKNLNEFCGSTNIVRSDLIPIPDFSSYNLLDFNFFSSHSYLKRRLIQFNNEILQPLPFRSVTYVINAGSWSDYENSYRGKGLKKWAKQLLYGVFYASKMKKEFNLTKIDSALWLPAKS